MATYFAPESASRDVPPLSVHLRPELPGDALHGLPGKIACRLAEATGADPAPILLSTLAMAGNAVGPHPHVVFGGSEHPARLFVVVVGDAAVGRKGTAVSAVRRLFREADPTWADGRIATGLKSPEAMIARVDDDTSDDCRLMIVEPEFARLAGQMGRTAFSPVLRAAWDGEVLENTTKDRKRCLRASHAHVSMVAMITGAELMRQHQRLSQAGGLESRFLYVCSAPSAEVSPFAASTLDTHDLAERLRRVLETSRGFVLERADPISRHLLAERGIQPSVSLPLADEVMDGWRNLVRDRLPRADSDGVASLWARAEVQVVRLAAAYAITDCLPVITVEHVTAAVAAWRYCAESAEILFGVPVGQGVAGVDPARAGKVVRYLHGRGWVSRTAINRDVFGGNVGAAVIRSVMGYLLAKGMVEHRAITGTGGGPRDEYRLTPPRQ